jgi:hypothetical protein
VNISADLNAPCTVAELFAWVDDLARYPQWMGLVHRADPLRSGQGDEQGWDVELRARIGPFARSKRLTMARTVAVLTGGETGTGEVVFERRESDGRRHSVWRLSANISPADHGSHLEMQLHYGGGLWTGGLVERALHDEIEASRQRLLNLIATTMP